MRVGLASGAIDYRISVGRLHVIHRGVYAVGRRDLSARGKWMAAVLACGKGAVLSHRSAAALWGLLSVGRPPIDVTTPRRSGRSIPRVGRHPVRHLPPEDTTERVTYRQLRDQPETVADTIRRLLATAARGGVPS